MPRKTFPWLFAGMIAIGIALLVGIAFYAFHAPSIVFARDAVHVIALEVSGLYERNPSVTRDEIESRILHLHEASVINLRIDARGKAVDPFGTPFRIVRTATPTACDVTVTSAGPDRHFETLDDISHTERRTGVHRRSP